MRFVKHQIICNIGKNKGIIDNNINKCNFIFNEFKLKSEFGVGFKTIVAGLVNKTELYSHNY